MASETALMPRNAAFLQAVQRAVRSESTLEQVLNNPAIRGYATGDDLSRPQKGLVAAAVSVMQDRLVLQLENNVDQLRQILEDQRLFSLSALKYGAVNAAIAIRALWSIPMVGPAEAEEEKSYFSRKEPAKKTLSSWVNWGNFATLAALVLLAVAIFYTKAYASFKERVENQEKIITEHKQSIVELRSTLETKQAQLTAVEEKANKATEDAEYWRAASETADRNITELNKRIQAALSKAGEEAQRTQERLSSVQKNYDESMARIARLETERTNDNSRSATYQDLWNRAREELKRVERRAERLNQENTKLNGDLQRLERELKRAKRG